MKLKFQFILNFINNIRKMIKQSRGEDGFKLKVVNCLTKVLKQSQSLIDGVTVNKISEIISNISDQDSAIMSIQYFLNILINQIQRQKYQLECNINEKDYQILQAAVQKSQAEIRKHIRLEQQLKIYMDGLEERVEQLQKQLKLQSNKYYQLYQNTKQLDHEKKELQRKVRFLEIREIKGRSTNDKQIRVISQKHSKLVTQPATFQSQINLAKIYNQKPKIIRPKNMRQKSFRKHEQSYKTRGLQSSQIKVQLTNLTHHQSKYEQKQANSDTFELKESEKNSRNLSKYLTDFKPKLRKDKNIRSNSVCT